MPILFDDLKPGDIVSYPTPDRETLRYLLYIDKKTGLPNSRIQYVFVAKQLRPPGKDEPTYKILEAFQPLDLVRYKDAILAVHNELMAENIPNNSFVWQHLGFESPEQTDLPWHHLVRITLTTREASRRTLSTVEEMLTLVEGKDLFKEGRGRTTLDMPPMPPTKNKGGKYL